MSDKAKAALTMNNNISVESQSTGFFSPSFRRTTMQNVRQSWVSTMPPSIPEAESMNIQPTAVLEKKLPTAKSRLSIIIQKGSQRKTTSGGFIGSPTTINEVHDLENYADTLSSPQSLLSGRPISSVSSSTDSSHSVSSSFTSVSIGTNNRDSMSDTTSMMSTSPSNDFLIRHRYSVPNESSSNDASQDDAAPRRASMPVLSGHHNSETNSSNDSVSEALRDPLPTINLTEDASRRVEAKELEIALYRSRSSNRKNAPLLSVPSTSHNDIFNARVSRASLRMSLNTRMQKRLNIALEIINTERHYVECLLLVRRLFLNPLTESLSTENPILTKKSISKIFANLRDLINVNTELLRRLEERIAGPINEDDEEDVEFDFWDPENGNLGDIFLDMAPFFKMYSIYVKNFNSALAVIDVQLRENPQFSEFFRNVIKTGQCKGLTLQAYLIMPVQRIPRYRMLLEDLLRKTAETHPDYLSLKKAYHVIENVATFVNETIRQHEMFITMLEIQKSLAGFDEALLIPGRRFIKKGTIKKICRRNHQQREFFLFSDILIYASPTLMENMYTFHRKIGLEDVMVLGVEDIDDEKNAFQILSPQKSFTVYADTPKDKESWINVIRETKDEYLSAKRTLKIDNEVLLERKDSHKKRIVESYHAPVWVPDSKADRCMNCSEEFTIFRRKHHCRACGKVVCHACSTRNFIIPGSNEKEDQIARACDPCFFTMFPDALRDEDLAPGILVWNQPGGHTRDSSNSKSGESDESNTVLPQFKPIHEAIVAKRCELCLVDFNVFRWRNECVKCRKIVCTDCFSKKPIDFTSLPEEFVSSLLSDTSRSKLNRRFSTINCFRLCDFCYLDLDPDRVKHNEEHGGGFTINYQASPPLSPKKVNPSSNRNESDTEEK